MVDVSAPYRFVPLSNLIAYPSWSDKVSHDKPFRDGINGELTVELENHTPMCIGGRQVDASKEEGKVYFYQTPEGQTAIRATSIKGMLRNVLEIASFSRMKQVEDQKLGVRDLSDSRNFYMENIKGPQAGWLKYDNDKGWIIYPCSQARVHQKQILKTFNVTYQDWVDRNTAMARYQRIGVCPDIKFDFTEKKNGKQLTKISRTKGQDGVLVVTGQPGPAFDRGKSAKKYEFVFYNTLPNLVEVSSTVMSGFRQIHQDTKEWRFWQNNLNTLKYGVPVFYHSDGTTVRSLGLAMMYKLPYKNSIHDAIEHTNQQHVEENSPPDISDLLFGYIADNQSELGLRGRVEVGFAFLQDNLPIMQFSPAVVLSAPNPTFYPAYIHQESQGRGYNQLMQNTAKIAGWKRYQVKSIENYPVLKGKVLDNKKVQSKLQTIANNSRFKFKIRLHNLRPVELGALLWALDFGECDECYHVIGMGKPLGLGRVKLNIIDSQLVANNSNTIEDNTIWLQGCRLEFQKYMNHVFRVNGLDTSINWEESDTIKALREYATPVDDIDSYQYLSTPKEFSKLKKRHHKDQFIDSFHKYNPINVADAKAVTMVDYQSNLSGSIDEFKELLDIQKQTQARQLAKRDATDEDKALYQIEDFIAKAEQEVTNTMKKNAHKVLKLPYDEFADTLTHEQKVKLIALANQVHDLVGETKQLTKIVNKINKLK